MTLPTFDEVHQMIVRSVRYRVWDHDAWEDVYQSVWCHLIAKFQITSDGCLSITATNPKGYVYNVIRNKILDYCRNRNSLSQGCRVSELGIAVEPELLTDWLSVWQQFNREEGIILSQWMSGTLLTEDILGAKKMSSLLARLENAILENSI